MIGHESKASGTANGPPLDPDPHAGRARSVRGAGWQRPLAVLLPPFAALVLQSLFWPILQPYVWFLFYPAVFFSSWIGGLPGGLGATAISILLVCSYFIPPESSLATGHSRTILSVGVFMAMGILFSFFHGRLRKTIRALNTDLDRLVQERTAALLKANETLADLKAALDEHAIVAITDARGKITYANDKFCAISKYSREELIGQDHRIINSGHHPKAFIRELWETITSGRVWEGEIKNRAKDGPFYWVDTTIVPFLGANGKPTQYIAIRADITERKQAEERIVQLNADLRSRAAQLETANRELESFAYSVSHDLRAPLRGMDGFSQAILEDYEDKLDATGQDYLRRIRAGAQRMGQLIDDLLKLSQVTRSEMVLDPVNLTALARKAIAELQPHQAGRAVQWEVSDPLTGRGDLRLMQIALENLLANALKFTGKCEHARIEFGQQIQGAEQVFFVRDNGAGFDMAYANRLFGAFQRLHSPQEFPGTGVGLATVQRIIHRHGGRVWAEGQPGKGATFHFTLPTSC